MVDTRLQSKRSISLGFEAQEGQHHPRQALGQCDWFLPLLGWISLYVGCSWCAKYGRYPDPCSSATRPVTIRLALLPSLPSIQVSDKIHAMALRGARALPRVQERIFFFFFPSPCSGVSEDGFQAHARAVSYQSPHSVTAAQEALSQACESCTVPPHRQRHTSRTVRVCCFSFDATKVIGILFPGATTLRREKLRSYHLF